jgi:hypothetical protein
MIATGAEAGRGFDGWNTNQALFPLPPEVMVMPPWA